MKAQKRYLLLVSCCAFLSIGYYGYCHWKTQHEDYWYKVNLRDYLDVDDASDDEDLSSNPRSRIQRMASAQSGSHEIPTQNCRMETCFDFTLCDKDFKVYLYPIDPNVSPSSNYLNVLNAVRGSRYFTSDPSQACVFILSLDTLDRDNLSKEYVRNMAPRVQRLPLWNNGQNHIIFNLYSGTWPVYSEDLGFNVGKAILAKASVSIEKFRPGFDISLPLFHKTHPGKGGESGTLESNKFPGNKKHLLAFKGKRYLYGIGSETRNSLYHLHNTQDIVLVTTCKHGGSWKEHKDERCDHDNAEYDRYDYEVLLRNSSFCLVPRGRRLGSFRFLEVLQTGCIPVILANGWELPFAEVIDWSLAVVWGDERLLLQVPDMIRSISPSKQLIMRQQTQILWNQYFSSVDKIILSALEIVRERVDRVLSRPLAVWNSHPGALSVHLSFSDNLQRFPFFYSSIGVEPSSVYTALIHVSASCSSTVHTSPLYKLIKNLAKSKFVEKILVIWNCAGQYPTPAESRLPAGGIPVSILLGNSSSSRYEHYQSVTSDAIFSLDEDSSLTTEELDFAFIVWRTFPDRIVGYPARTHYWSDAKNAWMYNSKWSNSYSMVLTGAAIYHRYYQHMYSLASSLLHETVSSSSNCDDILLNILVAEITKRPPIKLSQRKQYKDAFSESRKLWTNPTHFDQRSSCLNNFSTLLSGLPLLASSMRLDPVLFKDKVSVQRKKYRQIEKIPT